MRVRFLPLATAGLVATRLCVAVLSVPVLASPALAQLDSREAISLQQQILELRHQIQQGQTQQGGGGVEPVAPPIGGQAAPDDASATAALTPQLLERIATLEEQVRTLRGEVDQLSNQVQQQNAALAKQIGDLSFGMQQAHPAPSAPAALPTPPPPAPELLLQHGDAALAHRDYATAAADARAVMTGPKAALHVEAEFLLSQSLSGQHQYQQAATDYYDVYSHAPHGLRAPDALLGVSGSLLALGDKGDACQALRKLYAEFPQPPVRVRNAAVSMRGRAGCR